MTAVRIPERSKRYAAIKTRVFVADVFLTAISILVFQCFLAKEVSRFAYGISSSFYIAALVFSIVFLAFLYLVSFPLHIIGSFVVEKRFGLSRQTIFGWALDEGKSVILSLVLSLGCILVFYLILRSFPHFWWIILAVAWIFFSVILVSLMPVLLIPIFYKYLPLKDEELKRRIIALATRSGVDLEDVCGIDLSRKTAKANAALVGLGKTRKVILGDTLTENFTMREIEAVMAHEFAHFKYRHMRKLLTFSAITTLIGFFILFLILGPLANLLGSSSISDLYLLPVIALFLFASGLILAPLSNYFSRVLERQADAFALDITADPTTFISVMEKLGNMNLADTNPSLVKKIFLYDHPPICERIMMAERWESGSGDF